MNIMKIKQSESLELEQQTNNAKKYNYRNPLSVVYIILSYLIYVRHGNISMYNIRLNIISIRETHFREILFNLVKCGAIEMIEANKKSNAKVYFKITDKGLLIYNKIRTLKSFTSANNFLHLEDYALAPTWTTFPPNPGIIGDVVVHSSYGE